MIAVFRFLWVFIVVIFTTLLLLLPHLVLMQLRGPIANKMPQIWHKWVSRAAGIKVHVHGQMADNFPLMLVANHVSWSDIMVLGSVSPVTFIAKSDMKGWPGIGWLAHLSRTIFVERTRRSTTGQQADEIALRMAAGEPIVLFGEGTTGDGNSVLQFKSSLLAAGQRVIAGGHAQKVWLQPVAISYNRFHGMPVGRYARSHLAWQGDTDLAPHLFDVIAQGALDVDVYFAAPLEMTKDSNRKEMALQMHGEVKRMMVTGQRNISIG